MVSVLLIQVIIGRQSSGRVCRAAAAPKSSCCAAVSADVLGAGHAFSVYMPSVHGAHGALCVCLPTYMSFVPH
jgi:hypothetical protein